MVSVFNNKPKTVLDIIRDSLDVDAEGMVRFRSRVGRGSGKAVEIPGEQFDEFVDLMLQVKRNRETLVENQRSESDAEYLDE